MHNIVSTLHLSFANKTLTHVYEYYKKYIILQNWGKHLFVGLSQKVGTGAPITTLCFLVNYDNIMRHPDKF